MTKAECTLDKEQKNHQKTTSFLILLLCAVFLTFLYYRVVTGYQSVGGNYFSDITEHLEYGRTYGIKGEYSLTLLIDDILDRIPVIGHVLTAMHLALLVVVGIIFSKRLIRKIVPECTEIMLTLLAVTSVLVMPVVMPNSPDTIYSDYVANCWHSDNYFGMRTVAVALLLLLYDWVEDYLSDFGVKKFLTYTVLLTVINAIKPNFILGFAPAMLVMMISDIIRAKGNGFANWIKFGIPMLLSLPVLLLQYYMTYNPESPLIEDSHLMFVTGDYLARVDNPFLVLLKGLAFPMCVIFMWFKTFKNNKFLNLCLMCFVTSFLELFFIAESGERFADGNMGWGFTFFVYVMFTVCIAVFYKELVAFRINRDRYNSIRVFMSSVLLIWHLESGITYLVTFCTGAIGYYI